MARSFSAALNDLFKIDNSLADLDAAVSEKYCKPLAPARPLSSSHLLALPCRRPDLELTSSFLSRRKRAVSTQTSELEALEARLRATEERLQQTRALGSAQSTGNGNGPASPRRARAPLRTNTFENQGPNEQQRQQQNPTSPLNSEFRPKTPTRPGTSKRQDGPPMPAAPPTPGSSEGESAVPVLKSEETHTQETDVRERISADYVIVDKDGEDFPHRRD